MASSYTAFDPAKPDASADTISQFGSETNKNGLALWYAVISGQMKGFAHSVSGGTAEQPSAMLWTNGAQIVRASLTWGSSGGANGNVTQAVWEVSQDTGSTYAAICTQTFSYDSSGNLTSTTNAGGFISFLMYLVGKVKALLTSFTAHAAATGTAVHGLGTISTQAASSVAITGGAVDGTPVGNTTPASVGYTIARGKRTAIGNVAGSQAIDWASADAFTLTITNAAGTLTWSNLPSGVIGAITLIITNPGVATTLFPAGTKYPGGTAPSRTASGIDWYEAVCLDGSTVTVVQTMKDAK